MSFGVGLGARGRKHTWMAYAPSGVSARRRTSQLVHGRLELEGPGASGSAASAACSGTCRTVTPAHCGAASLRGSENSMTAGSRPIQREREPRHAREDARHRAEAQFCRRRDRPSRDSRRPPFPTVRSGAGQGARGPERSGNQIFPTSRSAVVEATLPARTCVRAKAEIGGFTFASRRHRHDTDIRTPEQIARPHSVAPTGSA